MNRNRILITGGGGFIGFHLATRLAVDPSNDITILESFGRARMDSALKKLCEHPNVHLIHEDLCSPNALGRLDTGYDEVYHLAAILGVERVLNRPVDVLRVNAIGTALLLDWVVAGGGKKLLFASTSEVYAWTQQFHEIAVPTPEDVPLALTELSNPRSTYAGSKMFGELVVTHWCQAAKLPFVIVRYHNVYGPRMGEEHVIPQLYKRAAIDKEQPLAVYSSDHSRAFCYVSDAVSATVSAMRSSAAEGCTINIGNDQEEIFIGDLARRILGHAGIETTLQPRESGFDPIKRRCPNIAKARNLLGYVPMVDLEKGLELTIQWYAKSFAGLRPIPGSP